MLGTLGGSTVERRDQGVQTDMSDGAQDADGSDTSSQGKTTSSTHMDMEDYENVRVIRL